MNAPISSPPPMRDPRALRILAKSLYRDLREQGMSEVDVMALAGELLELVTSEVRHQSEAAAE